MVTNKEDFDDNITQSNPSIITSNSNSSMITFMITFGGMILLKNAQITTKETKIDKKTTYFLNLFKKMKPGEKFFAIFDCKAQAYCRFSNINSKNCIYITPYHLVKKGNNLDCLYDCKDCLIFEKNDKNTIPIQKDNISSKFEFVQPFTHGRKLLTEKQIKI